ncbi:RHS repeat-associated core domain-containing protein [Pseudomonas sp. BW13M1]|uniref:RHS repeat-associated core domain-containing protein n=1 Tax=Pseudomonas peradeniyensis TaxID=2745488 RepID=A0A923GCG2_9PSED|nr:RHS repeat-associated core domain-containing protein [Pseudomonas peradeniyensis]
MSHPSSLPSTRLLVTDIAGSVLKRLSDQQPGVFAYCAFGHLGPARAVAPLLGFNNQHREPLTGVYLLGNGHRSFNPVLMRFVSADDLSPFGDGGINAYAYCQNDPINRTDPSGMMYKATNTLVTLVDTKTGLSSYMFTPERPASLSSVKRSKQTNTRSSSDAHNKQTGNSGASQAASSNALANGRSTKSPKSPPPQPLITTGTSGKPESGTTTTSRSHVASLSRNSSIDSTDERSPSNDSTPYNSDSEDERFNEGTVRVIRGSQL